MTKCFKCNKKLKIYEELIGKCKCNNLFCTKHRQFSQHSCTFDFKNHNKKLLEKVETKKVELI